jgi:hypothetical protein
LVFLNSEYSLENLSYDDEFLLSGRKGKERKGKERKGKKKKKKKRKGKERKGKERKESGSHKPIHNTAPLFALNFFCKRFITGDMSDRCLLS